MKKKISGLLILGLAIAAATACDEDSFFELDRPNQFPWQSVSELELAARAPYLYMVGSAWSNPLGALPLKCFGESDVAQYTGGKGNNYSDYYYERRWSDLVLGGSVELEGAWTNLYYISTLTNAALSLFADAEESGADLFPNMDESDRTLAYNYKGELLFMRAVAYWYLARIWAPPYNDANKDASSNLTLYRSYVTDADKLKNSTLATVEEVYQSVIDDLKDAIEVLPESYLNTDNNQRMRANKYAAEAMLARVLFYMGRQSEAKTYLDDVISQTSLYGLTQEPFQSFNKQSGSGYSDEVIWEICWSEEIRTGKLERIPGIFTWWAYNSKGTGKSGYCSFAISDWALKKVGWMDTAGEITAEAQSDLRFQQVYKWSENGYTNYDASLTKDMVFVWKYFRGATETDNGRYANRPLIRLADLLIMRSEIEFLGGDAAAAAEDLNVVRRRAGLSDIAASALTEDDIENERIKEMTGENGDRMYWLIALHKDVGLGDRASGTVLSYPYSDYRYNVPVQEQQLNTAYSSQ